MSNWARSIIPAEQAFRASEPVREMRLAIARYCAYRRWMPALAARCECWACQVRRETEMARRSGDRR